MLLDEDIVEKWDDICVIRIAIWRLKRKVFVLGNIWKKEEKVQFRVDFSWVLWQKLVGIFVVYTS